MRARLLAVALLASVVAAAACSGGGGSGGAHSPTPTVSPTISPPVDACQVVWESLDSSGTGTTNVFLVDAPPADWASGELEYSVNNPVGVFYYGYDAATRTASAAAATTAGAFEVGLGDGTVTGGTVSFTDSTAQTFFALDLGSGQVGMQVGSGGTGGFTGVWSDSTAANPTLGTGSVTLAWMGSNFTLGTLDSYATCYRLSSS